MERTLFIHIGVHKTGTSAIQSFLATNREKLMHDYSVLYPDFLSSAFEKGTTMNHGPFFKHNDFDSIVNRLNEMFSYSEKNSIQKIVLSWEVLYENPEYAKLIAQVVKHRSDIQCVVIAYIRRQDYWFESAWKQWGLKDRNFNNIEKFIQGYQIKWLDYFDKWADIFGQNNIIIRVYEREHLPNGLIYDFFKSINLHYEDSDWLNSPKNNANENFGFHRDVIEILKLNHKFFNNKSDNRLFDFFSNYLDDNYKKKPFEKYSLLSPQQRLEILEEYEPMNKIIAQKYMQKTDGRLFYEPWPDPDEPWEPYEGLTVEKFVPIFTQMLYNMDKRYQKQFKNLQTYISRVGLTK